MRDVTDNGGCVLCGSDELEVFLRRTGVPVQQNLLLADAVAAVNIARGDLVMTMCCRCGFVFNSAFDSQLLDYGADYDNFQGCSPLFADHMKALVEALVRDHEVATGRIVEIGSGNGAFLKALVEAGGESTTGYGFDPAYAGPASELGGRVRFESRFYGADCASIPADIVVSRHVIEHVPRPMQMLRDIRVALEHSPTAKIFFETPDVSWILRNGVIWDFFYEHCSLFSPAALATAFRLAGFEVDEVELLFDDQYQWLTGHVGAASAVFEPGEIPELARRFAVSEGRRTASWSDLFEGYQVQGPVALWGAGAKAVTLAGIIDPGRELIDCVVDINPHKQGCYLPGTGHPIVRPQDLAQREVATAVLLNPNYRDEVQMNLTELSSRVTLVDLMDCAT